MYYSILNIFRGLFAPVKNREAFEASFYRLPERIQVSWQKDGKMIVGKVIAGEHEFHTQGKNADDFIKMVNDAVYTVYEIPYQYLDHMRAFSPNEEAKQALYNRAAGNATIVRKELQVA